MITTSSLYTDDVNRGKEILKGVVKIIVSEKDVDMVPMEYGQKELDIAFDEFMNKGSIDLYDSLTIIYKSFPVRLCHRIKKYFS